MLYFRVLHANSAAGQLHLFPDGRAKNGGTDSVSGVRAEGRRQRWVTCPYSGALKSKSNYG